MRRLVTPVFVAVVLGAAVFGGALTGCGGGDEGRGDVAADDWVATVCQALRPWRGEIEELMARAQRSMDAAAAGGSGPAAAGSAKTGLVDLLAGAEASSERARSRVAAAGVPDADNGRRVAAEFAGSLGRTRDAYGRARDSVANLPTAQPKQFYDAVSAAFAQLATDYSAGALDLDKVGSRELKKSFAEVPECR